MAIKFGRPIEMRDAPRHQTALTSAALDLAIRPRRNRKVERVRGEGGLVSRGVAHFDRTPEFDRHIMVLPGGRLIWPDFDLV